MARMPHLRYRNTHSSAKRVFQSSASPFGTGVKPCLHIRPATLQTLISQYTLLNTLYQLKRLAAAVQSAFAATLEEHAVHLRVKAAEIHASVSSACCYVGWQGVPQHTRSQSPAFWCICCSLPKKGAQCRETASSAPPFSVRTERGPLGTALGSSFSIARARKSFIGSQAGPGESSGSAAHQEV